MPAPRRPFVRRWNALPALTRNAPPRVLLIVGTVVVLLGALIVSRPLTSSRRAARRACAIRPPRAGRYPRLNRR